MWWTIGIGIAVVVVIGVVAAALRSSGGGDCSEGGMLKKKCLSCGAFVMRGYIGACPRCGGTRYGWG